MPHLIAHFPCRSVLSPHFPSFPNSTMHPSIFPSSSPSLLPLWIPFPQVPSQDYCSFPLTYPEVSTALPSWVLPPCPGMVEQILHINTCLSRPRWTPLHFHSLNRGVIQKPEPSSITPCALLFPDPFGQGSLKKRWLKQVRFVLQASSVIVGLF